MGLINIDDIRAGMVLAHAITDRSGRVLLRSGCEITDKQLRILRMWGITEADIQGVAKEDVAAKATAELDPALLEQAEAQSRDLFRTANLTHTTMQELFRLCTFRLARRAANGGRNAS